MNEHRDDCPANPDNPETTGGEASDEQLGPCDCGAEGGTSIMTPDGSVPGRDDPSGEAT